MKLLSANQLKSADQYTIANTPISSIDLMEKAAKACFDWIIKKFNKDYHFSVFCGNGNNGGDGLAIARLLIKEGYKLDCYTLEISSNSSIDFTTNLNRLHQQQKSIELKSGISFPSLQKNNLIIDALFGTGLTRPAKGLVAKLIQEINKLQGCVISIDLPSGMYVDTPNKPIDKIIKATYNLTLELPKFNSLLPEYEDFVGHQYTLPIGLNKAYIDSLTCVRELVTKKHVSSILKIRKKHTHKGTYGFACVISGAYGSFGATLLCSKAVLKSGAGKCVAYVPKSGHQVLQLGIPEVMVHDNNGLEQLEPLTDYSFFQDKTLCIGPGIGTSIKTRQFLEELLKNQSKPIVLDADALNCLSLQPDLWKYVPANSILTPHPKEFERLVGETQNSHEKIEKLLDLSSKHKVIILLKGATTIIATPTKQLFFNVTGNPGMATAGSGDVLTGILCGLLSQGYTPLQTVLLGTYLHGLAGNYAAEELTEYCLMAGDLINFLPQAYKNILKFVTN